MDLEKEYILTSLQSALEILVLIQDDTTKDHPVCNDIGSALNLPIGSIIESIKYLEK